jgi:hypothetical protein
MGDPGASANAGAKEIVMVRPSGLTFALALAAGLLGVVALIPPNPAAADSRTAVSDICGHKFEPGPIVDGHNRQPTPAEFEARIRQYSCSNTQCSPSAPSRNLAIAAKDKRFTPDNCF